MQAVEKPIVRCKKCGEPVPPYLYAINYHTSGVIWVNIHARIVPCEKCGADVREGNEYFKPAGQAAPSEGERKLA